MMSATIYTPANYHKSNRALIAAKYSKAQVTVKDYSDEIAKNGMFPIAALPPLFEANDADKTTLFEANAIAYYLGNDQLRGGSKVAEVSQWTNYADLMHVAVASIYYPSQGVVQANKNESEKAKTYLGQCFNNINQHLSSRTYLVTEKITQADITLFCTIECLLRTHYQVTQFKSMYPHLYRWADTIGHQPEVVAVLGEPIVFCVKPLPSFDAKKFAQLHPRGDHKKSESKKDKKPEPKKEEKKAPAKPTEPAPKKENPLKSLPATKFDMDEFKREYSNKSLDISVKHFFDHVDKENCSVWKGIYNYPEELKMAFMSCNLISGMFQRLEQLHKVAFGVHILYMDDGKQQIEALWVWPGQKLIFDLSEDLSVDSPSYTWSKLEFDDPNSIKEIEKFLRAEDGTDKIHTVKVFK